MAERHGLAMAQRDRVVEGVTIAESWDSYMSLRALAAYSSLSERTLRGFVRARANPLPCFRVGGRVVVKRAEFDAWMQVFREPAAGDDADAIVRAMQGDLDGEPPPAHRRALRRSA